MDQRRRGPAANEAIDETSAPLGLGWALQLTRHRDVTFVRVHRQDETAIELTIRVTSEGPVLRATGHSMELAATHDIHARCERFLIDATDSIEMRSGGELTQRAERKAQVEAGDISVHATRGDVRVKANDDVQLKGEGILLNCDRPEPTPLWSGAEEVVTPPKRVLPVEAISGDLSMVESAARRGETDE